MLIQLAVGFALGWIARSINFENPSMSDFKFAVHGEGDEPGVWLVAYEFGGGKKKFLSGPTGQPLFWRDKARAQKKAEQLAAAKGVKTGVHKHTNKTHQLYAKAANSTALTLAGV